MSKDLFHLLNTVKVVDVIVTIIIFATIIGIVITQWKKIKSVLEHWRKKRNFEDNIIDAIDDLKSIDKHLQEDIDKVWDTMAESREVSKNIREDMYGEIKNISSDLKTVIQTIDDMQAKNDLSKQAAIKEKIEKLYRECHANMVCTDTAFETLKDLIDDYERHGGTNSFVHSLVQPEMYTWERIKTIPDPADSNR